MGLSDLVASSRRRLVRARGVADTLRHDEELHRAAMKAVFALEDCHEALVRTLDETRTREPAEALSPEPVLILREARKSRAWLALVVIFTGALVLAELAIETIDPAPTEVNATPRAAR